MQVSATHMRLDLKITRMILHLTSTQVLRVMKRMEMMSKWMIITRMLRDSNLNSSNSGTQKNLEVLGGSI